MILDVNTYIGHFPFRKVIGGAFETITVDILKQYLKKSGIDKAVVSNLNAVFYRNTMAGNLELHEQAPQDNMLIKACVINPKYPEWENDFVTCVTKLEFQALELYPYYHEYRLNEPEALKLLDLAGKLNVPVILPCAIENIRQKHHLDTARNLEISEVSEALKLNKTANVILTNGPSLSMANALKDIVGSRSGKVFYDFTRLEVFNQSLANLIALAGIEQLVFSSITPLQYAECQLVKLEFLNSSPEDKTKVLSKNLEKIFNLQ